MKILVSHRNLAVASGLAANLRTRDGVSVADVAQGVEGVLDAWSSTRYDVHVVSGVSLPIAREVGRRILQESRAILEPLDKCMVAFDPSAMTVLEAARLGFGRVIDADHEPEELARRITAAPGSSTWMLDSIEEFPVGSGQGAPRLGDFCRDDTDRRVVELIVGGLSDAEIAIELNFAVQSVRNKISKMLHRSGFRNRTDLAVHMVSRFSRH